MTRAASVTVDLSGFPKFDAALRAGVDRGVGLAAVVFEGAAKAGMQSLGGGTGGRVWGNRSLPGQFPGVQSGQLRQSITSERAGYARYNVGTRYAVGAHMEFGAHPYAKKGKYLTVPLNYEGSRMLKRYGSVRNIPGLQIIAKTRRGWLMGFKKGSVTTRRYTARRGKLRAVSRRASVRRTDIALFALVPDVLILPRPWLLPTVTSSVNRQAATAAFAGAVNESVRGALSGRVGVGGGKR